jgi:hypothetical protein
LYAARLSHTSTSTAIHQFSRSHLCILADVAAFGGRAGASGGSGSGGRISAFARPACAFSGLACALPREAGAFSGLAAAFSGLAASSSWRVC